MSTETEVYETVIAEPVHNCGAPDKGRKCKCWLCTSQVCKVCEKSE